MKGLSPFETRQLILSIGTHKTERALSPVEVAKYLQKVLDAGEKRGEIAERLHLRGTSMIGRFLRLLSLPIQVRRLINWGSDPTSLSFYAASEIARLEVSQDQITLAKAALESQLNKSDIIQVVQIHQRSNESIDNCIKAVLKQRPIVERRHLIAGELCCEELKTKLNQASQLTRDNLLQTVLKRHLPNVSPFGTKLGDGYFLIVGDDQLHSQVMSLSDDFEKTITEYLIEGVRF
ncbi:hypothetical protein C6497_09565 [Candidatus Poribacteria bacterium]|nr:MAG: hypothetical protein C6497_09565 [Candidatus Poribacteria bacterium]